MNAVAKAPATDPNLVVAANLRGEIAKQRTNGAQIASMLGLSEMYVSRRLSGKVAMSPADLVAFANLLRIPVARLFAETQNGPASEETGPKLELVHPLGLEPRTHWVWDKPEVKSRPVGRRRGNSHPKGRAR